MIIPAIIIVRQIAVQHATIQVVREHAKVLVLEVVEQAVVIPVGKYYVRID